MYNVTPFFADFSLVSRTQRFFGCWLTFEGSIVDMQYTIGVSNIVDLESEVVIEPSVNETFSILPLLC